ncbi:GYD domain-containing protein [Micromonospora yasonensis]|uniref:GYD domain-containing protein n=1 Tax=Micromonospora yasonensis TaxID=1128667 RepID=UPI00222EDC17|nr:GYD domain-containing protein [Micromonospora yasonensis]MCW3840921.1 GYD domain-containing protein [Micromonospora yasonensis]
MPTFLLKSTYTAEGLQGLIRDGGTKRAEIVRSLVENAGGQMASLHFAFADEDTYVLCDLPDHRAAAALAIAIGAARGLRVHVTPLLSPAEVDEAARMPTGYTPPGD